MYRFLLFCSLSFLPYGECLSAQNPFLPPQGDIAVKDITDLKSAKIGDTVQRPETKNDANPILSKQPKVKTISSSVPSLEYKVQNWYIMSAPVKQRKICYMVKYPEDQVSNHKDTRKPYMMITFVNKRRYEISISAGYKYRGNSTVTVSIDGAMFNLSANANLAWSQGVFEDFEILHAMGSAFRAVVASESSVGTYAVDTYDLAGFKEAYQKMISTCLGKPK